VSQPNAARFPRVTLYAQQTGGRGGRNSGPTARHFQVRENGQPARIVDLETEGGALDVCLALDCSLSMTEERKMEAARYAARLFLRELGPNDRAALVTFGSGARLMQPLTLDRVVMDTALAGAEASGRTTTFFDAVSLAIQSVALPGAGSLAALEAGRPDAHRVVVALTDGQDLSSTTPFAALTRLANAHGVSLCMVALGTDAMNTTMEALAKATGGAYVWAPRPKQLHELYRRLALELRTEYRIVYESPNPRADGTQRRIELLSDTFSEAGRAEYQAPGQGSILVTSGAAPAAGPSPGSAAGSANPIAGGTHTIPWATIGFSAAATGLCCLLLAVVILGGRRYGTPGVGLWLAGRPKGVLWVHPGETRIGRGTDCELVIDSQEVSRLHARIEATTETVVLFDAGSSNGTFVNGKRITGSHPLFPGDRVRLGDWEVRFAGVQSA
jgi:VWFA-related protein